MYIHSQMACENDNSKKLRENELDPRIQVRTSKVMKENTKNIKFYGFHCSAYQIELEKLNNATDEINRLEMELDVSSDCSFTYHLVD